MAPSSLSISMQGRKAAFGTSTVILSALAAPAFAQTADAAADKPNILIIYPDDVGWTNVGAYGHGIMGYNTPNIDKLAAEGAMFTEHYAQPLPTAGRASLITGQYPIRSGMTTVGLPGSALGLKPGSLSLAEVLKGQGYATGQFGKNQLGDNNFALPTMHGFDEFYGNLYHYLPQDATMTDDVYGSGMMEHDMQVGQFLDRLREMDNTIIVYSTDCGPEHVGRFHGGITPFRGEKLTTYEGGVEHVAADVLAEKNRVIDGVNNLDWWEGKSDHSNRNDFIYYEGTDIRAVRLGKWKMHFATSEGMFLPWQELKFPRAVCPSSNDLEQPR